MYCLALSVPCDQWLHTTYTGTVLRLASDRTVRLLWIDQRNDQIVEMPNGVVDFNTAVPTKGASDCHGLAFNYVNHW